MESCLHPQCRRLTPRSRTPVLLSTESADPSTQRCRVMPCRSESHDRSDVRSTGCRTARSPPQGLAHSPERSDLAASAPRDACGNCDGVVAVTAPSDPPLAATAIRHGKQHAGGLCPHTPGGDSSSPTDAQIVGPLCASNLIQAAVFSPLAALYSAPRPSSPLLMRRDLRSAAGGESALSTCRI